MSYLWYKNIRIKDPADGEGTEVLNANFQFIADRIESLTEGVLTGSSGISGYSGIGTSGYSGYSGISGYSGTDGVIGVNGDSGFSGYSGISGYSGSGFSGYIGISGFSGYIGTSGYSGPSGFSGYSGISGFSGISGYSGKSGFSGYSGISGFSGYSGISGFSGYSGISGFSGYSGTSITIKGSVANQAALSGIPTPQTGDLYITLDSGDGWVYNGATWDNVGQIQGPTGDSGFSGYSGISGFSGYSGLSGFSGYSGLSGFSGYIGVSGFSGYIGVSGYSGISGFSGYSGISGYSGSGFSGYMGVSGFSGYIGTSGYSGLSGFSGYSGKSGFSGYSGISGYSGSDGIGSPMVAATSSAPGVAGMVPTPQAGANSLYLRGDATWTSPTFVNVKDYGATGDYTTDDTRAIQAAIDAASVDIAGWNPLLAGVCNHSTGQDINGRTVYFPSGRYRITAPLKVPGGVYLLGDGRPSSLLDGVFTARTVAITQVAGTATATTTGKHGYQTGDMVTVDGAAQAGYNISATVTVTSDTQFTYTVDSGTASPATGSPTVQIYNAAERATIEGVLNAQNTWANSDVSNFFIRNDVGHGIRIDQSVDNAYTAQYVLSYYNSAWTDYSAANKYIFPGGTDAETLTALLTTSDELYIGDSEQFVAMFFLLKQAALKSTTSYAPTDYRHTLIYEYSAGSGNWTTFSLETDLTNSLSTLYRSQMYLSETGGVPDISASWATDDVNGVIGKYWIRIRLTVDGDQPAIIHNVNVRHASVGIRLHNLIFKTVGWGVFFPDAYSQACSYDELACIGGNAGLIFIEGNANWISRLDTEGGRFDATFHPPYGMITVIGSGNSVVDCIAEGGFYAGTNNSGYAPAGFYIRGASCEFHNNWIESSFTPFDGDHIVFEQAPYSIIGSNTAQMKLIDSYCCVMNTTALGFGVSARTHKLIGNSSLIINTANGYFDSGVIEDPRISIQNYYNDSSGRMIHENSNPVYGNLLYNGDFQRGLAGWYTLPETPLSTTISLANKLDATGKCLKAIVTNGDIVGRRFNIYTRCNVPPNLTLANGFAGYKLEVVGNAAYVPNFGGWNTARQMNVKTVIPLKNISTGTFDLQWITSMGLEEPASVYLANDETYTDSRTNLYPPFRMFPTADDYLYLSMTGDTDITALTFDFDVMGVACTPLVQYYDHGSPTGGTWQNVTVTSDTTSSLTSNGTITFTTGTAQTDSTINSVTSRWIRIKLNPETMTTSPQVNWIKDQSSTLVGRIYTYAINTTSVYIARANRASTGVSDGVAVLQTFDDYLYVGSDYPVNEFYFKVTTAATGITTGNLKAEYWDGKAWVQGTITDGTFASSTSFAQTGTISFTVPTTRYKNTVNKVYRYWTRFRVTAISTAPEIVYVKLPLNATFYLSDVYVTIGERHNNPIDSGNALRFSNGNVIVYASEVLKHNGSTWVKYVTKTQSPNEGTWLAGDQVLFNNTGLADALPDAGHYLGWVCVTSGTDTASVWQLFGKINNASVAIPDLPNLVTDPSIGNFFTVALGGDRTMNAPSNALSGQTITYAIKQSVGSKTITWTTGAGGFRFSGGLAPTLSTTVNYTDYIGFIYNSIDNRWDCVSQRMDFAP